MNTTISPVVVPYSGAIPGGVRDGMEIEVQGTVPHFAHNASFSINLSQGPQLEPMTLLHFNVRLSEHCVVLNHMSNNSWGSEDRKSGVQFHKGKPFDVRIMVKPQMYKLKVNGRHIGDFAHRLPKETAQFIVIKGDVSVSYIRFQAGGGGGFPHHHQGRGDFPVPPAGGAFVPPSFPYPTGAMPAPQPAYGPQPIYNPPVPFVSSIPGGLSPGRMINISGVPFPNASRFTINLQSATYDGCDVAFHFDVRFYATDGSVNTIVRNHCQSGAWGAEERDAPYFPFVPNQNFDIIVLAEPYNFKVAVNNQHLLEFRHRLPIQAANTLRVTGDVRLTQVRFQ